MTTNQTIDGVLVPRETLQKWLDDIGPIRHVTQYAALKRDELRALLDTFESQYDGMTSAQAQAVSDGIDGLLFGKPAAQPQGEPVAFLGKGFTTLETVDGKYRIITQYKNRDDAWSDYIELCKAKQPAPIAVVMPERKHVPDFRGHPMLNKEYTGWNACLDELKRLNPTRPNYAKPPPGAEPCGTHPHNDGLDEMRKPTCCGSCPGGRVIQNESK